MNKSIVSLFIALISGLLIYINGLALMLLPYSNLHSVGFRFGIVVLYIIAILISIIAIFYRNDSVLQSFLRWLFVFVFFIGFFLLGAYIGILNRLCDLFKFRATSSSDNASGLLMLCYVIEIFISSFAIVLGKTAVTIFRKIKF